MKGIKSIPYQNQVHNKFSLIVLSGAWAGTYSIQEPDGFDEMSIIVDVNEDYFNVDNFILGDTSKIRFLQYQDKKTFDLIQKIYEEQGGDAQIIFKWFLSQKSNENDVLGEGYELNLNKYRLGYEKSGQYIECEIKNRESQNKFFTREDTTINLFATKNIDEKEIIPVKTKNIILKSSFQEVKSHWSLSAVYQTNNNLFKTLLHKVFADNYISTAPPAPSPQMFPSFFLNFNRNADSQLGDNIMSFGSLISVEKYIKRIRDVHNSQDEVAQSFIKAKDTGKMLFTRVSLENVQIRISNLYVKSRGKTFFGGNGFLPSRTIYHPLPFSLWAGVFKEDKEIYSIKLKESQLEENTQYNEIIIDTSETFSISRIPDNAELRLYFKYDSDRADTPITDSLLAEKNAEFIIQKTNTSISISTEVERFSKKNKVIRLFDALDKIAENYSDGKIRLKSEILNNPTLWGGQVVATGYFLRGIANLQQEKINTSFKSLFFDSAHPLFALGYDLLDNSLIIEDIRYFFKDYKTYDLTDKIFIQEDFTIENDTENTYNSLVFGTKKYSTKKNGDLNNFNTKMECATPVKSLKRKLDKTTDFIIDEYKINDLIDDNSNSTNDNDDDLVIIDTIYKGDYKDNAIYPRLSHQYINNKLTLIDYSNGWDSFPFDIGDSITILEGYNIGTWEILEIKPTQLTLNKSQDVQTGDVMTRIEYTIYDMYKNRSASQEDGFIIAEEIINKRTCTNLIHNPKYQLNRWFPYFGGGLSKKKDEENIVVTSYKNNGRVIVETDDTINQNAIKGQITLNEPINIGRLRLQNKCFFNGQKIEITLPNINFDEFYNLYSRWRYGRDIHTNEEIPNRGYIDVKVNNKVISIYPIGSNALQYEKGYRELTIRGKIKA